MARTGSTREIRLKKQVCDLYTEEIVKKQRHCFANEGLYSQNYGFSSSHVWI